MRTGETLAANCVLTPHQSSYLTTTKGAITLSCTKQQFFRLSPAEIATIKTRYGADHQLALAVQMGFSRMSGQPSQIASIRALYTRRRTLHEHQKIAKRQLGFRSLAEMPNRCWWRICARAPVVR